MKITDAENIIHFHIREVRDAPCSISHHLNKKGGLIIHLNNVMNLAKEFFADDETLQAMALIHDVGKSRTYKIDNGEIRYVSDIDHVFHTIDMIKEAGYDLTEEERNAILLHHGGFTDPKPTKMCELCIKLHMCDHLSTVREQ